MEVIIKKKLSKNFSNLKDSKKIKKYIDKYWKKNHILVRNKKLFNWLHISRKNKIDFLIKKKNDKIVAILGVINNSRDINYTEISLAIWHSIEKVSGLLLFLKILSDKKIKLIKATTISPGMIKIYKSLGFTVRNFNQYYITHLPLRKQKLSLGLIHERQDLKIKKENLVFDKIDKLSIRKKRINSKFFKWRYCNHPVYNYHYISDKNHKLILICRLIKIKDINFISIVDFIGSFKNNNKLSKNIITFLIKNNFHHIEFLHYGSEDKNILSSGFKKANFNQVLPLYTEPFSRLKKINFTCGYINNLDTKNIKIVRSDGDADRPSL